MKKKTVILLTSCFVFGVVSVLALYAATNKAVHEPNSFLRKYKEFVAEKTHELDLGVNSWYIAGATKDKIYLGNITAPFQLLITDYDLKDTTHIRLKVNGMDTLTFYKSMTVKVDSPYFYLADGIMPGIFRGKMGEWIADQLPQYNDYFTQLIPIGSSSFAIRTNYAKTREYVLGKLTNEEPHIAIDTTLLQKQIDGFFCTDGMMSYNRDLHKLIYTYYYRNQYIVYDTNLRLHYRGHTIDTFSHADIKIQHIASEGTNTLTYKRTINKATWTTGNYLFINSDLLAKNDRNDLFPMMSIIDVYDVTRDRYLFSFLLQNVDGERSLRSFRVIDEDMIISLAEDHLLTYKMKEGWLSELSL